MPTSLLQRGLAIAAGYLAAPRISAMIPFEFPGGKLGQLAKEFIVISLGSGLVSRALGPKYGKALFAGGVIHIGVDLLQTYVTPFGGGSGVGYYWPTNPELGALYGASPPALPDAGGIANGSVLGGRLSSRFNN